MVTYENNIQAHFNQHTTILIKANGFVASKIGDHFVRDSACKNSCKLRKNICSGRPWGSKKWRNSRRICITKEIETDSKTSKLIVVQWCDME